MGFFSELKEDLSQAVNELMPMEDGSEQAPAAEKAAEERTAAAGTLQKPGESMELSDDVSLEKMLENIDDIQLPEEEASKPSLEEMLAAALDAIPEREEPDSAGAEEDKAAEEQPAQTESIAAESYTAEKGGSHAAESYAAEKAESHAAESYAAEKAGSHVTESHAAEEAVPEAIPEKEQKIVSEESNAQEETSALREESKGAERTMDSYASRQASDETAVITEGMQIHGDVISEGSMDVIGTVDGNIEILGKLNITGHINGNSKAAEIYAEGAKINGEIVSDGSVKIGDSSVIIGNITAKSAAIAGAVKGDIDVQGPVILDSSAIVMGNIKSKSVQINNGAVIEGMCSQCYADVSPTSFFDEYKPEIKSSRKSKQNQSQSQK